MFGFGHHCGPHFGGRWAGRRGWHGSSGRGWSGRHGSGGGDMMRAGRMLAQGDLRLIALALIAEQPRHNVGAGGIPAQHSVLIALLATKPEIAGTLKVSIVLSCL